MNDLKIERLPSTDNGVLILRLTGALDAHNYDELQTSLEDLFAEETYKIILDMEHVTYISSAGVGTLVSATIQARGNGGNVVLIKISERLREVLSVLGLLDALQCAEGLQPALAQF